MGGCERMNTRPSGQIARKTSIHKACRLDFQSALLNLDNQSLLSTQRRFGHVRSEVGKLQIPPDMPFVTTSTYGWNEEADCFCHIWVLCLKIIAMRQHQSQWHLFFTDSNRPLPAGRLFEERPSPLAFTCPRSFHRRYRAKEKNKPARGLN